MEAAHAQTHMPASEARSRAARAAEILSRDPRVRAVFLFGSAAQAEREDQPVRDIDLAILTTRPTDGARSLEGRELFRLRADVVCEVGGPLDLVPLSSAGIVLAWEVAETGVCLYEAEPHTALDFVIDARRKYWDWKPFLETQKYYAELRAKERLRDRPT